MLLVRIRAYRNERRMSGWRMKYVMASVVPLVSKTYRHQVSGLRMIVGDGYRSQSEPQCPLKRSVVVENPTSCKKRSTIVDVVDADTLNDSKVWKAMRAQPSKQKPSAILTSV
jgi:hypothetical protein